MKNTYTCSVCQEELEASDTYEYRGAYACSKHFKEATENRDHERAEVIAEQNHKTDRFKGLDLSDSQIGKANREIFKADIEIANKESGRVKAYEGR